MDLRHGTVLTRMGISVLRNQLLVSVIHANHFGWHGRESRETSLARRSRSSFAKQKCDGSAVGCYTVSLFSDTVFGGLPPSVFHYDKSSLKLFTATTNSSGDSGFA